MASNINSLNIDPTFPIAGVDNDSQGFRTNFKNIQTNLAYAKTEIEDLQNKTILKGALSGGGSVNNDMNGTLISGAEIYNFKETIADLGSTSGTVAIIHTSAHYWSVNTSGSIVLTFSGFPVSGKLGRVKLKVILTNAAHTVTLPTQVSIGTDSIEGFSASTRAISFSAAGTYIFEFFTDDQGASIAIIDLTRPRRQTATNFDWSSSASTFDRYEYALVTTGFAKQVNNRLFIDSVTTLATGSIYLPNPAYDGQTAIISSNNAITTLKISSNAGTLILGNVTTLAANSTVKYQYVGSSSPAKWFKTT
jgi:hypothetical protein